MIYSSYVPSDGKVNWLIGPYVGGRVVYDLGAGEGILASEMETAKRVVAVEVDKGRAQVCRGKGLEVIEADFLSIDLSEAEVLYVFQGYVGAHHLANKLDHEGWCGTVICNAYPLADVLKRPNEANETILYKGKPNISIYVYHLSKGSKI